MAKKTWEHPDLGKFKLRTEFDETEWLTTISLEAFAVFKFRGGTLSFRGSNRVQLEFKSDDEDFVPSAKLVKLALKVVNNSAILADRIKKAFYKDLLGTGPESGMWWHDDQHAREYCGEVLKKRLKRAEIQSPDDFELLLGEPSITIWDDPKPFARIDFSSAFEDEHGVEAITNGTTILGLGYQGDADLYIRNRS